MVFQKVLRYTIEGKEYQKEIQLKPLKRGAKTWLMTSLGWTLCDLGLHSSDDLGKKKKKHVKGRFLRRKVEFEQGNRGRKSHKIEQGNGGRKSHKMCEIL